MKRIILMALCAFLLKGAIAQVRTVTLSGDFKDLPDTDVLLLNVDGKEMARTRSEKGRFIFKTPMETGDARRYGVHVPMLGGLGPAMNKPAVWLFVNSGKVSLSGEIRDKSIHLTKIKGAPYNQTYTAMMEGLPVHNALEVAISDYNKAFRAYNDVSKTPENLLNLKKAGRVADSLSGVQSRQIREVAQSQPSSTVAAVMMSDYFAWSDSTHRLQEIVEMFDPAVRESNYYLLKIKEKIARLQAITIGQVAPDFMIPDVNGAQVKLSSTRGKYVLLDFWASWCGPCRKENPVVLAAYEKYKAKNFTVVAVSLDTDEAKWKKAVVEDKMPWLQLSDLKGSAGEVAKLYEIKGIPANFLLDPEGKIIAVNLRGDALGQALEKLQ